MLSIFVCPSKIWTAKISSRLVDDRRLGSAQKVGAIIFAGQSDPRDPFVNKASILPGAYIGCVIGTARKCKILQGSTSIRTGLTKVGMPGGEAG